MIKKTYINVKTSSEKEMNHFYLYHTENIETLVVIEKAGHSLELEDLDGTLNMHKYIVRLCDDYLGK